MVCSFLRASRFFYKSLGNFCLPVVDFSVCHSRVFSNVREIKVKCASNICAAAATTTVPDEETHVPRSELVSDDQNASLGVQFTPEIEKKYVHRVYDAIGPHLSSTRFAKWPKVAAFLSSLPSGSLVLDAGCGNGKYLGLNPRCFFIGCDISHPLMKICADKGHEILVADAVNLPYRTGFGDAAISIDVLHHLSTESRRKRAIEELVRVVKKGGLVLITVWAVEQEDRSLVNKWTPISEKYVEEWIAPGSPRERSPSSFTLESIPEAEENCSGHSRGFKESSTQRLHEPTNRSEDDSVASDNARDVDNQQEYFVPWHLPYHCAEVSGASASALANGLAKKDNKKGAVVYNRYYHVFSEGELERLVSGMENAALVNQFFDKSNWCIILEKTSWSK